jgi:hypothetical protein
MQLSKVARLPNIVLPYCAQVKARYRFLLGSNPAPPSIEAALDRDERLMTWADLELLQSGILEIQDVDELRRHVWSLREEIKETVTPQEYADYVSSSPPVLATATQSELHADALQLTAWLNASYALVYMQSRLRNRMSALLSIPLAAFLLIVLSFGLGLRPEIVSLGSYTIVAVAFSGLIGALISAQQRLQSSQTNTVVRVMLLESGGLSTLLSPITGAVFALIMYMLFIGGLVNGDLFPKIDAPSGGNWMTLLLTAAPAGGANLAKLVIWSFIAGFSERLVPDTVDRLAAEVTPATPSRPAPSPSNAAAPAPAPAASAPEPAGASPTI